MIGFAAGWTILALSTPFGVETAGATIMSATSAYGGIMNAITVDNAIVTSNELLNDLFTSGGMQGCSAPFGW